MAYEYEGRIIGMLGGVEDRHFIDLSDHKHELKEVYAKAKAFDEIEKSIIQIKCNYKGNEEGINKFIARETEYIMYREDK